MSDTTIKSYKCCYNQFNKSGLSIEQFLLKTKNKRNTLALFRLLYPDETKNFKFPRRIWKPKILPSKEQLRIFYNALPDREKTIFLLLAESGLRINELLNSDIDGNMLIPKSHTGSTKHSFISFFNTSAVSIPKISAKRVQYIFKETSKKTGIMIYPHLLRSVFAREMSLAGCPSHYIDAFCGRTPQSVLARSYTDYSPETLKAIYDKFCPKSLISNSALNDSDFFNTKK